MYPSLWCTTIFYNRASNTNDGLQVHLYKGRYRFPQLLVWHDKPYQAFISIWLMQLVLGGYQVIKFSITGENILYSLDDITDAQHRQTYSIHNFLKVCMFNACSLRNKFSDMEDIWQTVLRVRPSSLSLADERIHKANNVIPTSHHFLQHPCTMYAHCHADPLWCVFHHAA